MAAFDSAAGQKPGLEIWRIEKMHPVRTDSKTNGTFYSGDCYLVLHTIEKKGAVEQDLHFWLGKDSSQDEQGAAAYMTVALDDHLGGRPVQYREVQNHESSKFLSLFPGGIQYLDGGIESGFNKVVRDQYPTRLFHIKGKRNPRVQQVALTADSLNDGDVFILDHGLKLYQWNGATANKYEKAKGLEILTKIKNEERGGRADTLVLDSGKNDDVAEFWSALGGKKAVHPEDNKDDEELPKTRPKLIRISDASGSLEITEIADGNLQRSQLDENDVFIVDSGAEVFVWVGKGATKDERNKGMAFGTQYLQQNNRPSWTPVTRVPGGGETVSFKAQFASWDPPRSVDLSGGQPKPRAEEKVDASGMFQRQAQAEQEMVDDATGQVKIWRIENFQKVDVSPAEYGQFFAGDSYIVLYSYQKKGKPHWIIYFWQGRDSSADERGAAALLTVQMDDELGGDPVQVRVVQGKEPNHFLSLFKGRMVVRNGGIASAFANRAEQDNFDTDAVALFHIRGTNATNTRAVQVDARAASLNSGDCFVLLTPGVQYIWQGRGSNEDERSVAANVASILQYNRSVQSVQEGEEPAEFWEALGGQDEYPRSVTLESGGHEPRLFHMTTNAGNFRVEEVFDFSQDDLFKDDVMLLDTYDEVFVWIGPDSSPQEKELSLKTALDYVAKAPDGRSKDTPVFKIHAGAEPPNFTCHFLGWNDAKASDFSDPYAKKLASVDQTQHHSEQKAAADAKPAAKPKPAPELVRADSIGPKGFDTKFSYEQLKSNKAEGIDVANKEKYLSDDEFQKVFGQSRADFDKLAKWKQADAKKKVGLF